ncbi:MAG: leucine-rich repeat domain-containing protein, partial [Clostridia bacterium]|nr:leucine-rich repeat domain-containing protein [Clostridia bacterium]
TVDISEFSYMKLYELRIKANGRLVRDFVPVYVEELDEYGLYDRVVGKYYGNQGTMSFFYDDSEILHPDWFPGESNWGELFNYTRSGNNATITGLKTQFKTVSKIVIPNTIDGYPVVAINGSAFASNTTLTHVELQSNPNLTSMGQNAFLNCTNLESFEFGNCPNLTTLVKYCFMGCTKMVATVPSSLKEIGDSAFLNCYKLTGAVNLTGPVTAIGTQAFRKTGITSVNITTGKNVDSAISLNSYTFAECPNLKTVKIVGHIDTMDYTFWNCPELESFDGTYMTVRLVKNGLFRSCIKLSNTVELNFLKSTKSVASMEGACTYANNADPANSQLDACNFANCVKLKEVRLLGDITVMAGDGTFKGCTSLEKITFSPNITRIGTVQDTWYGYNFSKCTSLKEVDFGTNSQITYIGRYAFENCTSLEEITLPSKLESICERLFIGCSNLKTVNYTGDVLTTIGQYAFQNCANLTTFDMPESL